MKSLALMKLRIPEPEIIDGEIVEESLPLEIAPDQLLAPFPPTGVLWLIAAAAGLGFVIGAALSDDSTPKQPKAPVTRRRNRRQ